MISPEAEEDAIRYVLGEMSPDEERAFAQLLETDPELAAYVAEVEDTFGALATTVPQVEPPAGMRDRIMAQVSAQATAKAGKGSKLLLAALTGALILTLTLFVTGRMKLEADLKASQSELLTAQDEKAEETKRADGLATEVEQLQSDKVRLGTEVTALKAENTRLTEANTQLTETNAQLATDLQEARNAADLARLKLASLSSSVDETYEASLAWSPQEQSGMVEVGNLPVNEPGKQYQVWIIDEGNPNPISGGVFEVAENAPNKASFKATQPVSNAVAFAISVEETGGVPSPQGPSVLSYGL